MSPAQARSARATDEQAAEHAQRYLYAVDSGFPAGARRGVPRPATRPDPGRRTVQIATGRTAAPRPRAVPTGEPLPDAPPSGAARATRRRRSSASARAGARPDRLALWAVVMGLLLALVAGASGPGVGDDGGDPPAQAPPAASGD